MKKSIFLAMAILTIACTKTGTSSLKSSSVQSDVINPLRPIGIYKVCLNTDSVKNPYYRVVLRYETNDLYPTGYITYRTSKGLLVDSIPLPPYTRHMAVALFIGKNSPIGHVQITDKGVIDTTAIVDGSNICN